MDIILFAIAMASIGWIIAWEGRPIKDDPYVWELEDEEWHDFSASLDAEPVYKPLLGQLLNGEDPFGPKQSQSSD